jgi:hypothetical protein
VAGPDKPLQGYDAIDAVTQAWRQGDCVLGQQWFVIRGDPSAASPLPDLNEILEDDVAGLVVLSQTCDIVRSCRDRPYVEVCPLVTSEALDDVKKARRPAYAFIPGVAAQGLVAHLDQTMTVTKNVLASWTRVRGCPTLEDQTELARALKRKRGRFAFPDDFNVLCDALQRRLIEKHNRQSPEGTALRRLREIRVEASPDWNAAGVKLMFWFVRNQGDFDTDWSQHLAAWLRLVPPTGRYTQVNGQVATLNEMSAADYVHSIRLDLDHLSRSGDALHP